MKHVEGIKDEMIANNLMPYVSTHPGEIVKDEIRRYSEVARLPCSPTSTSVSSNPVASRNCSEKKEKQ